MLCHAIENRDYIFYAEESGPTWYTITIKYGACSALDLLYTALGRVLVLIVSLVLLTTYPVGAEKLVHAPNELFL